MSEPLFGIRELAAHLGIPVTTVRYWQRKGLGPPALRLGKYLKWRPADVDAWLETKKATKGGEAA